MPNFIAGVAGIIITVVIVEGIVARAVVKPVSISADLLLERIFQTVGTFMAQTTFRAIRGRTTPYAIDQFFEVWPTLLDATITAEQAWLKSWLETQRGAAVNLRRARDFYYEVLSATTVAHIDKFVEFVEVDLSRFLDDLVLHELLGSVDAARNMAIMTRIQQSCELLREVLASHAVTGGEAFDFNPVWRQADVVGLLADH